MKSSIMSKVFFARQSKSVIILILLILTSGSLRAQQLHIGQTLPDVTVHNVINNNSSTIKLSDFKGKLLLLDFWGHGCHACFAAFPRMEALQKEFEGKIKILLINRESRDSTIRWFAKYPRIRKPKLPLITGDTILDSYFPHETVPHYVWIDNNGKTTFITDAMAVTENKILDYLNGNDIKLSKKIDYTDFKEEMPLVAEGNGRWLSMLKYNSSIYQGRISGLQINLKEKTHLRFYKNLVELIRIAVTEGDDQKYYLKSRNDIVLEVNDTTKYFAPNDYDKLYEFEMKNAFIYELQVPPEKASEKYKYMQQDLKRYFNINFNVEKRKILCLVLTRISADDRIATKGPMPDSIYAKIIGIDSNVVYNNVPVSELVSGLNYNFEYNKIRFPVVDGTGYRGNIDLIIGINSLSPLNLNSLRKELRKYGLDLIEKKWLTNVLVIKEDNYIKNN
jgi:thiol-disulfide isomerase/thioredoxin